jgi:hypothetical protein
MSLRSLTPEERALLDFLLQPAFVGRDELAAQAATVKTSGRSCTCGCPSFWLVPDTNLPPAPIVESPPVDAHGTPGGKDIGVMLMVRDGYLYDVEIYDFDDKPWGGVPSLDDLKITQRSERDASGLRYVLNP